MSQIDLSTYTLVKDKDGQLKYYKDGQVFTFEQVEALLKEAERSQTRIVEKVELKPVLTLQSEKKKASITLPAENKGVEEDVQLAKNVKLDAQRSADQKAIDERVKSIVIQLKMSFAEESIERRFYNILTTYFRGLRQEKEIEYILELPRISGGMELPVDKVKLILSFLRHQLTELQNIRKTISTKVQDDVQPLVDLEHRIAPPPPAIYVAPKAEESGIKKEAMVRKPFLAPSINKTMTAPAVDRPTANTAYVATKPVLNDVKIASRQLIGPLEELAHMTLLDFRQLGRNESEIREEVLERIALLADQTYVKKIQGIKAWRNSPIFKLYLEICLEGVRTGKSVVQIIDARQIRHEEALTLSEFEVITELNYKLRY